MPTIKYMANPANRTKKSQEKNPQPLLLCDLGLEGSSDLGGGDESSWSLWSSLLVAQNLEEENDAESVDVE